MVTVDFCFNLESLGCDLRSWTEAFSHLLSTFFLIWKCDNMTWEFFDNNSPNFWHKMLLSSTWIILNLSNYKVLLRLSNSISANSDCFLIEMKKRNSFKMNVWHPISEFSWSKADYVGCSGYWRTVWCYWLRSPWLPSFPSPGGYSCWQTWGFNTGLESQLCCMMGLTWRWCFLCKHTVMWLVLFGLCVCMRENLQCIVIENSVKCR